MAKIMIFSTTPTAAEAIRPMVLIMAVMDRKDILTRPSWSARGKPTFRMLLAQLLFRRRLLLPKLKAKPFLYM